ncbi:MAG TPA: ROK family protein [Aldersonia sp.]
MRRDSIAAGNGAGTSPQQLRRSNLRVVLDIFWAAAPGTVLTAGDLIERAGLTRATVLGVCDDLIELGWIQEIVPATTGPAVRGRRARHFTFRSDAGYVIGIDLNFVSATAVVATLDATLLGRGRRTFAEGDLEADRLDNVRAAVRDALTEAGVTPERIIALCMGVAAAVDRRGTVPSGNPYWESVHVDPSQVLDGGPVWQAIVDNDANLAARAEERFGPVDLGDSFVTMLADEAIGAGVVSQGVLLRGHNGGAGELRCAEHLNGVGTTDGIAYLARRWAADALAAGEASTLAATWKPDRDLPTAEDVFAAAARNDPLALDIVERLGERFAIVIATIASLINPQTVVVAGGVAPVCGAVITAIESRIGRYTDVAPRIVASQLGSDVVLIGAVHAAIDYVREHALDTAM